MNEKNFTIAMTHGYIIEYGIGFNNKGELVIIEFNRTTWERKYIQLVVKDGKVVMAKEDQK